MGSMSTLQRKMSLPLQNSFLASAAPKLAHFIAFLMQMNGFYRKTCLACFTMKSILFKLALIAYLTMEAILFFTNSADTTEVTVK